jgi:hypothetical protein
MNKSSTFWKVLLVLVIFLDKNITTYSANGQDVEETQNLPYWTGEVGIDLLPLINKGQDPSGYVVKFNLKTKHFNTRQAFRVKIRPGLSSQTIYGNGQVGVSNSSWYLSVGYEWQKLYGRFGVLKGVEPFLFNNSVTAPNTSTGNSSLSESNAGISGFLGGRYYLGKHVAITVESHLIYNSRQIGRPLNFGTQVSSEEKSFVFYPIRAVYLSYHF